MNLPNLGPEIAAADADACLPRNVRGRPVGGNGNQLACGPGGRSPVHKSEHYGDGAFLDDQPRLIDLIPRRLIAFAALLVGGIALIGALEAGYTWMPDLVQKGFGPRAAALDLREVGSLAGWFSSLVLLAASLGAVLVYTVRRHQMDDYHGHYRVWLWAALCWFLMATDTATALHRLFQDLLVLVAGTRLTGDGSIWWIVPSLFLVGAIGSRLAVDMWACRLSAATLITAAACYVLAAVARLGWLLADGGHQAIMLYAGAAMLGHLLLLLAMVLHARHVLLDAEGLLPRREAKAEDAKQEPTEAAKPRLATPTAKAANPPDKEDEQDEDDSSDRWVAVDNPHGTPQPVLRRVGPSSSPAAPAASSAASKPASFAKPAASVAPVAAAKPVAPVALATSSPPSAPDSEAADQKLSKAERKALKERLLKERLQRERQKAGNWK